MLEGMMICAYAIGAEEGYIYVRAEYPKAVQRLKDAIRQLLAKGFLGKRHLRVEHGLFHKDKGRRRRFRLRRGDGADRLHRGQDGACPVSGPPSPPTAAYGASPPTSTMSKPTRTCPGSSSTAPEAFSSMGTENSKGSKVFALAGKIQRGGLAEVPMGITINEIVYEIGGGIKGGKKFKAVQMGGPSGGCIPASMGEPAHRLPADQQNRRHHGLGRPRGHGRDDLHGRYGKILPAVHPG